MDKTSPHTEPAKLPQRLPQGLASDVPDLLQMWQPIWRRKWSILALTLVVMLVTALVTFTITPTYRATTTLLIEQRKSNVVSIEQVYGSEWGGNEYLQTQFELLMSRALAERVVRKLELTTHPEFDPRQQEAPLIDIGSILGSLKKVAEAVTGTLP